MAGTLFVVATPIGNLGDITARALETLARVHFLACEDTRRTQGLLTHFGLSKPRVSLPAFAEGERAEDILDRIDAGEDCALVTDAGTPAISDPGDKLVGLAAARGIRVVPIPGASAAVAALSASGLRGGRFYFVGFLPRQVSQRQTIFEEVRGLSANLVFYESPRRLGEALAELLGALGDRRAVVARELTKIHEELARGTLSELSEKYAGADVLGEVVIAVEGRPGESRWTDEEVDRALRTGLERGEKLKALSVELGRQAGWPAQEIYRRGLGVKSRK